MSTNLFGELTASTICHTFLLPSWVSQLRIQRFVNSSVSQETLRELLRGDFLEKRMIFAIRNTSLSILYDDLSIDFDFCLQQTSFFNIFSEEAK